MSQVPIVPPMSKVAIQQKASQLVRELCPDAWQGKEPVPLDILFEIDAPNMLNIETGYTDISIRCGIQAYGYTNLEQRFSFVDNSVSDAGGVQGRRFYRSTVGHELGHCFLHIPLDRWRTSLHVLGKGLMRERRDLRAFEDPEWQAWEFCKELCMPSHLVKRTLEKYKYRAFAIEALMEQFDMSFSFAERRLRSLQKNNRPEAAATASGLKYVRNPRWAGNLTEPRTKSYTSES